MIRVALVVVAALLVLPTSAEARDCHESQGPKYGTEYIGRENHIWTRNLICPYGLMSADQLIGRGAQYKGKSFRITTGGARWYVRWSCSRTWRNLPGSGPVAKIACNARRGELEPGAGRVTRRTRLTFQVYP
jgi:hypothetical protein